MIRIGHNPNTNMLPMFYYLPKDHPLLQWVTAEPTGHNRMLAQRAIDLAPISSFSCGEHWQEYAVLSGLSVSTRGKVGSILLFSRVQLEELDGRVVALTSNSATSVNLVKILLHRFYGVRPRYRVVSGSLAEMFAEADAALLIADMALREALARPECLIVDLGAEWRRWTGFSMTYAVWAFPRALLQEKPEEISRVHDLLLTAKAEALANLEPLFQACTQLVGGTPGFWREYFGQFTYDFDAGLQAGLAKYYELCLAEGLLPTLPRLHLWPEG